MFKIKLIVNDNSFPFYSYKEAFSSTINLALMNSKYATINALKERLFTSCDLITEFCQLKCEDIEKGEERKALKRISVKMKVEKDKIKRFRNKDRLVFYAGDLMMSIEGHGTLHGFGWASQKFGDPLIGNAEKTSVKKP